eukprot:Gb_24852 [translate_table: standard]
MHVLLPDQFFYDQIHSSFAYPLLGDSNNRFPDSLHGVSQRSSLLTYLFHRFFRSLVVLFARLNCDDPLYGTMASNSPSTMHGVGSSVSAILQATSSRSSPMAVILYLLRRLRRDTLNCTAFHLCIEPLPISQSIRRPPSRVSSQQHLQQNRPALRRSAICTVRNAASPPIEPKLNSPMNCCISQFNFSE